MADYYRLSDIYYIEVNMICIVILLMLFLSLASRALTGISERLFRLMLVGAFLICLSDMFAGVYRGEFSPGARRILWTANTAYFIGSIIMCFFWVLYSMYVLYGRFYKKVVVPYSILMLVAMLIFVSAPLNGWAFTIDDQNLYHRGPLLWVQWLVVFPSMMIPSILAPFTRAEKQEKWAVSAFVIFPFLTTLLQAKVYGITVSQTGMVGGLLLLYVMLQSKVVDNAMLKARWYSEISNTDTMTGLPNRRAYDERLEAFGEEAWIGVVFMDLNGLKRMNDLYGHKAGDQMICEFAGFIRGYFHENDIFRISGDEFVILSNDPTYFTAHADEMIQNMGKQASAGYAIGSGDQLQDLVKLAEDKMYEAKSDYYARNGLTRRA